MVRKQIVISLANNSRTRELSKNNAQVIFTLSATRAHLEYGANEPKEADYDTVIWKVFTCSHDSQFTRSIECDLGHGVGASTITIDPNTNIVQPDASRVILPGYLATFRELQTGHWGEINRSPKDTLASITLVNGTNVRKTLALSLAVVHKDKHRPDFVPIMLFNDVQSQERVLVKASFKLRAYLATGERLKEGQSLKLTDVVEIQNQDNQQWGWDFDDLPMLSTFHVVRHSSGGVEISVSDHNISVSQSITRKTERVTETVDVGSVTSRVEECKTDITKTEKRVDSVGTDIKTMEERIRAMEETLNCLPILQRRIDDLSAKLDQVNQANTEIKDRLDTQDHGDLDDNSDNDSDGQDDGGGVGNYGGNNGSAGWRTPVALVGFQNNTQASSINSGSRSGTPASFPPQPQVDDRPLPFMTSGSPCPSPSIGHLQGGRGGGMGGRGRLRGARGLRGGSPGQPRAAHPGGPMNSPASDQSNATFVCCFCQISMPSVVASVHALFMVPSAKGYLEGDAAYFLQYLEGVPGLATMLFQYKTEVGEVFNLGPGNFASGGEYY
ncbi:hypothetical protein BXZ70DRAFT_749179 [Cristinia sonorae]|uniref:Uncharacterized protein n=1 Tax=Cristinia sonorae TaxID=1940300 RepID=A0A8K0UDA0_9AGAR|nr:hypothetical protein BXZ70DRAFT_749179 [Cristinia sonorae]